MANAGFEGLIEFNNFIQGFVDMIPGGRTFVDTVHFSQNPDDNFNYNDMTNSGSTAYFGGQGTGIVWNLLTLKGAGTLMVSSKYACVAKLGGLLTMSAKTVKSIDRARWAMEFARSAMYSYKLFKNQQRLSEGLINQAQFDAMRDKDLQSYLISGSIWAVPGKGGLWIAMGNLVYGTITNEAKTDIALQSKRR